MELLTWTFTNILHLGELCPLHLLHYEHMCCVYLWRNLIGQARYSPAPLSAQPACDWPAESLLMSLHIRPAAEASEAAPRKRSWEMWFPPASVKAVKLAARTTTPMRSEAGGVSPPGEEFHSYPSAESSSWVYQQICRREREFLFYFSV